MATGVFNTVPGSLLLIHLTDTLAVSPAPAGPVVLLPTTVDLLVSPYIGIWSDGTRSSWGSRRPWMSAGALTLPVLFSVMFVGPPLEGTAAAAYVAAVFALGGLGLSLIPLWGPLGAVFSSVPVGVGLSGTTLPPWSIPADRLASTDASGRRGNGVPSGLWTSGEAMARSVGTGPCRRRRWR